MTSPVSNWNFADVWDVVADTFPDRLAVMQGPRRMSWSELDLRAANAASSLRTSGLKSGAKVAQYLYNCPEYIEVVYACFKASLVPVNTNYRYSESELLYLWDNCDAEAVVFHASFALRVEAIKDKLRAVRLWLWVAEEGFDCPPWATPYEDAAMSGGSSGWEPSRSGDDLLFIYTGGTTGMPKGVMWRQDDLFDVLNRTGGVRYPKDGTLDDVRATLRGPLRHPPGRLVPGPPLMHGTGLFTAMSVMACAGSILMPEGRHFDPVALLDLIAAERVTEMSIVGDAFAKPILAALDAEPARWDISSLWLIVSSGVIWSAETKQGFLRHNPRLVLVDTLGSSEAIGIARSTSTSSRVSGTAGFSLGADTVVISDDGRFVEPGSGERGMVALRGRGPIGYYKDETKTAATFRIIDGERWSVPGDYATVAADGSLQLLGRGSVCINSGGEKIFPEEVEQALVTHRGVADAVVVGVPDDRFGEMVVAVVEPAGPEAPALADLAEWSRRTLAGYKAPRRLVVVDSVGRSPSGKVDYRRLRDLALESLGLAARGESDPATPEAAPSEAAPSGAAPSGAAPSGGPAS